ncbi:MAG TPA: YeeE/YedE thiosulfate transporter family protein [Anaeromyxobacter sp.]
MDTRKEPRPYLNPYVAGTILGVVLFLTFYVTGGGLGASAGMTHVQTGVMKWFAPDHVNRTAYFAEVAGGDRSAWAHYAVYMIAGTVVGGFLSGLFNRRVKLELRKGPNVTNRTRVVGALIGGALMGYGARLARGCTSGQALSGGAVLSVGSWAFALAVFAGAYAVAWFFRRLWI